MADTTRLLIMRHAKSDWFSGAGDDFSRPLSDRGLRDAQRMGQWLVQQAGLPQRILSSPSQRTRQTLERMSDSIGIDLAARTTWLDGLYHASLATLRTVLADQADARDLMLLGHNPGLEELLAWLVGEHALVNAHAKPLPTAAVYVLEIAGFLDALRPGCARVVLHQRPKGLGKD